MSLFEENKRGQVRDCFWASTDYRNFIALVIEKKYFANLNSKTKLSHLLEISPTFVSKVLSLKAHFSPEHLSLIALAIDFSELETMALIDKSTVVKTDSPQLKSLAKKRLNSIMDQLLKPASERPHEKSIDIQKPIYWKIQKALFNGPPLTFDQLQQKTQIGPKQLKFHLNKLQNAEIVLEESSLQGTVYKYSIGTDSFKTTAHDERSMRELSQVVRTMAQTSLSARHPISLVDDEEHYVSGSYILALNEKDIDELKLYLTKLMSKVEQQNLNKESISNARLVGLCFDFFDLP